MKRKFSFGLPPMAFGSFKAERSADPHGYYPEFSPPPSPLASRRPPLSARVEVDLRQACTVIVSNPIPSHLYRAPRASGPKPLLDYAAIKKTSEVREPLKAKDGNTTSRQINQSPRLFDDGVQDLSSLAGPPEDMDSGRYTYKPESSAQALFDDDDVEANTSRRRHDVATGEVILARPSNKRNASHQSSTIRTVTAPSSDETERPQPTHRTYSQGTSVSTPHSDSTDYHDGISTNATSAAMTPGHASKRASAQARKQSEEPAVPDIATEQMWNELEQRQQQQQQQQQMASHVAPWSPTVTNKQSVSRPPSRARSISRGIREYIRPSTSGGYQRDASRDVSHPGSRAASIHSNMTGMFGDARRPSVSGWRSWTRSRRGSVDDHDDNPASSRGRAETRNDSRSKRKSVNLNRELPPLPSLDQWKAPEPEKPRHIANLWATRVSSKVGGKREKPQVRIPTGAPQQHEDKQDVVAARLGTPKTAPPTMPVTPSPAVKIPVRKPVQSNSAAPDSVFEDGYMPSETLVPVNTRTRGRSTTVDSEISPEPSRRDTPGSARSFDMSHRVPVGGHAGSASRKRPSQLNLQGAATAQGSSSNLYKREIDQDGLTQFSKLTMDQVQQQHSGKLTHVSDISTLSPPPPVPPKDSGKQWWPFKSKQKKQSTWMDRMEKMGVKEGLMFQDEAASAPVIRY